MHSQPQSISNLHCPGQSCPRTSGEPTAPASPPEALPWSQARRRWCTGSSQRPRKQRRGMFPIPSCRLAHMIRSHNYVGIMIGELSGSQAHNTATACLEQHSMPPPASPSTGSSNVLAHDHSLSQVCKHCKHSPSAAAQHSSLGMAGYGITSSVGNSLAQHGQVDLSNQEGGQEVDADGDSLSRRPGLDGVHLRRHQPSQRAPGP